MHLPTSVPLRISTPIITGRLHLPRTLLTVTIAPFISGLVFSAPPPFFPRIADDLGITVPVLGQFMTAIFLLSAVIALVIGPLADRYGAQRLLMTGALAAGVSLLSFGLAPSFPFLIVAGLFGGVAAGTLPGLSLAIASNSLEGSARQRAIGLATAATAAAAVIGVPVIAIGVDRSGWRSAFVVTGLLMLAAAALIRGCLGPTQRTVAPHHRGPAILDPYWPILNDRTTLELLGASTFRALAWFGAVTYSSALLADRLNAGPQVLAGTVMAAGAGFMVGGLSVNRVLGSGHVCRRVIATNIGLALAVVLIFSAALGIVGTLALIALAGFLSSICMSGITMLVSQTTPAGNAATMTLNSALLSLGAASGSAIGGALLAVGGFGAVGIGLPLFALVAALLAHRSGRPVAPPAGDLRPQGSV